MDYFVIGADGNRYGPANVETLSQWALQNRVLPGSMLQDAATGQQMQASQVAGIFSAPAAPAPQAPYGPPGPTAPLTPQTDPNWSQAPSNYYRPVGYQPMPVSRPSSAMFWNSIIRSILALVFFFVLGGIGLIVGGYAVYYGYRAMDSDHRLGKVAFGFSILCFLAVAAGWAIRLSNRSAVYP